VRRIYKTRSVSEKTYHRLEAAILRRELEPGEPLVINELASELGVSRTPVKEALLLLEGAGLVANDDGRITVARLSLTDLEEVFEVREAVELFALTKVAASGLGAPLEALYDVLAAHRQPVGDGEARTASELDLRFHRGLVLATGNARLVAIWDKSATELRRFWNDGVGSLTRIATDIDECLGVLDALRIGDEAGASEVLVRHLEQTKQALAAWQREQGAVPTA
jgi:DNA-binding GntR family transcriptional regulator